MLVILCCLFYAKLTQLHCLFAIKKNYAECTHNAFTSILPVPARYYLPARIRETARIRLQASGLWHTDEDSEPKRGPFDKPTGLKEERDKIISEAFTKEKVCTE